MIKPDYSWAVGAGSARDQAAREHGPFLQVPGAFFGMIALAFLLGGCSSLSAYDRPAAPVAAHWPEGLQLKTAESVKLTGWRQHFTDPRLQALIAAALENNRDLRIATARIKEARAQYGIQQADRMPTLNLNVSRSASLTPSGASQTGADINSERYDLGIGVVSYELDFWGRVASLNEAAKASYLATEAAQRAFRLSLTAEVANAYLSELELRERTRLVTETARARAETRELTARRRELGVSGDLEYLQAEGAYQAALAERANLERQLAASSNLLDLLLGQPQREIKNLPEGRPLAGQEIPVSPIAELPAEVLLRRPDVFAAEQRLIAANASIGAARAAFLPRITLTGAIGLASRSLTGLFDGGSGAWSFQPALVWPLFDSGRLAANTELAETRKVIAVAEYEKTLQQAFREVADLLTAREKLTLQLAAQQANAEAQARRLKLVEARFAAGIASHLEVLDAQREAFTAEQGALQVRRALLSAAAQLYKALAVEHEDS